MKSLLKCVSLSLLAHLFIGSVLAEDFKLHRYVASTWNTNSYWLESDSGVVLIDAQLLRSDAKLLAALIKSSGKTLKGALVTHAHSDHFAGLNALTEEFGSFPVYTTEKTAEGFKSSHARTLAWAPDVYGDDFDKTMIEADQIVADGTTLEIAGIRLVVDDIGAGESENSIVIYQPDRNILFTGDATMHGAHFYLGDGFSEGALAQHHELVETYGEVSLLYPGHGDPASPSAVLDTEIEYISFQRSLVMEALGSDDSMKQDGSGLREEAEQGIKEAILARYPYLGDYGIGSETLLGWNISGLVGELKAAGSP